MSIKHRFPPIDERLLLQSASRALDVLEAFAEKPDVKSLSEIAAAAGINKSAAQRISQTLLNRGNLEQTDRGGLTLGRSEEHTSELQSLMRISYAVFCLKKKNQTTN